MHTKEQSTRKAILLLNVGTPDKPEVKSVRFYLSEFLNDPFVIDLPWVLRKLLVNLIIVPFRAPKSTQLYKQLWTEQGSPLLLNAIRLQEKLQRKVADDSDVFVAMRYGNPSIASALCEIKQKKYTNLIVVPLFPQYAASTTETALREVKRQAKKLGELPPIKEIKQFYQHPAFIRAWKARASQYNLSEYDHIIFSYHGLPLSHVQACHPDQNEQSCNCISEMPDYGKFCYKATVYETTRLLASELGIGKEKYSVSFQSRLSKNWLSPFTDELVKEQAKKGNKRILIFAPAFVADCLETIVELGIEYAELFRAEGGEKLTMVESLNDLDQWVDALDTIITENTGAV